jgi:hypothetical protein
MGGSETGRNSTREEHFISEEGRRRFGLPLFEKKAAHFD